MKLQKVEHVFYEEDVMKFQSKSNVEWKLKWNSFNYKGKSFSVVLLENNIITIRNINKDEIIYTEQIK
jgi:hypothetical protein